MCISSLLTNVLWIVLYECTQNAMTRLQRLHVSKEALEQTKIGLTVNRLRKGTLYRIYTCIYLHITSHQMVISINMYVY